MKGPHLVYFADPMCSWCWGFEPVIEALRETYGESLPIRLVMGGLRPGTEEAMTEAAKREIRSHWEHVRAASGQPFDLGFFDRTDFVYDTEPASRAVVAVRRIDPPRAFDFLRAAQAAFYAGNRDVTKPDVLAEVAHEIGLERVSFLAALASEDTLGETWQDFAISRSAGVAGFPTLIAGTGAPEPYALITRGFQPAGQIIPVIAHWLSTRPAAS